MPTFSRAVLSVGDNGMSGTPRLDLSVVGLDANDPAVFAVLMLVIAFAVLIVLLVVVRSPFGHMLGRHPSK